MSAQPRKVVHADIKPDNAPELASRYLDVPNMPWEQTKFPGIRIKVLYSDDSGITTALFKLDPGAVVPLPRAHRAGADLRARGHDRGPRRRLRAGSVRVAAGRQPARGGGARRRPHPRLLPQAQPLRLRGEVLHRGAGEIAAGSSSKGEARSRPPGPGGGPARAGHHPQEPALLGASEEICVSRTSRSARLKRCRNMRSRSSASVRIMFCKVLSR